MGLCGPSDNLLPLTIDNNNLLMHQKTFLEWHYCFGHHGLQQVQFILHHFPFVTEKFSAAEKCIPLCQICEFGKAHCRSKAALLMTNQDPS